MSFYEKHVFICTNQKEGGKKCCQDAGASLFFDYIKQCLASHLNERGEAIKKIRVSRSGCLGRCSVGPCLVIYPEGVWYTYHSFTDMDEIVKKHILGGEVVARLLL
ncbi:MAG: (2Fe-2S) ferredoxin domain-containing protein [Gammaproteobacteria bacterium]|nr:(2Fe-2S) ferredoxin domain-containing protein [Gammaproteobacteria bacterium]